MKTPQKNSAVWVFGSENEQNRKQLSGNELSKIIRTENDYILLKVDR